MSFAAMLDEPGTGLVLATTVTDALAQGVFGVPSFVLGDRVFWGNDRLLLVRHRLLTGSEPAPAKARQHPVG